MAELVIYGRDSCGMCSLSQLVLASGKTEQMGLNVKVNNMVLSISMYIMPHMPLKNIPGYQLGYGIFFWNNFQRIFFSRGRYTIMHVT